MKAISRGYRTARADSARLVGWTLVAGGVPVDNPTKIPHWTCYHDLQIAASVAVDLRDLLESTGLPPSASIGVTLLWRSVGGTGLRGAAVSTPIVDGDQTIFLAIPAGRVAHSLSIEVQIILLARPSANEGTGIAVEPGSILWSSSWGNDTTAVLEGDVPRLPVAAVSGQTAPFYGRANSLWFIDVDQSDLHHSVASSMRVLLNRDSPAIQRLLQGSADVSHVIKHFLLVDQRRQLLLVATDAESDFDESVAYPAGSIGHAISNVVKLTHKDLASLRALRSQQPAEFELEVQQLVDIPSVLNLSPEGG